MCNYTYALAITPDGISHVMTNVKPDASIASASYSPLTKSSKDILFFLFSTIACGQKKVNKKSLLYKKIVSRIYLTNGTINK